MVWFRSTGTKTKTRGVSIGLICFRRPFWGSAVRQTCTLLAVVAAAAVHTVIVCGHVVFYCHKSLLLEGDPILVMAMAQHPGQRPDGEGACVVHQEAQVSDWQGWPQVGQIVHDVIHHQQEAFICVYTVVSN